MIPRSRWRCCSPQIAVPAVLGRHTQVALLPLPRPQYSPGGSFPPVQAARLGSAHGPAMAPMACPSAPRFSNNRRRARSLQGEKKDLEVMVCAVLAWLTNLRLVQPAALYSAVFRVSARGGSTSRHQGFGPIQRLDGRSSVTSEAVSQQRWKRSRAPAAGWPRGIEADHRHKALFPDLVVMKSSALALGKDLGIEARPLCKVCGAAPTPTSAPGRCPQRTLLFLSWSPKARVARAPWVQTREPKPALS